MIDPNVNPNLRLWETILGDKTTSRGSIVVRKQKNRGT